MIDILTSGKLAPLLRQCLVTAGVSFNFVGNGLVIAYSAVLLPSLREAASGVDATAAEESWIASILAFGLLVGNLTVTPIMEWFGRKKSHILTLVPVLIGWAIICLTTEVHGLLIARFLQGIGVGWQGSLGPIIIGETADPKHRGVFLTFVSLSLTLGNLVAHALGTFCTWTQVALLCALLTSASFVFIIFSPETPSWLIKQGRYDEGRKVFFLLRNKTAEVETELENMIVSQKMARKSSVEGQKISLCHKTRRFFSYLSVAFKKPEFYKPVTIAFLLYTIFQFSGINVISSYALDIIGQVVGPESNKELLMIVLDVERLACNILAIFLMKMMGRRVILFACGALCILTYFAKAFYLYAKTEGILPKEYDSQWLAIILIAFYVLIITVSSSITFAIPGEIMPLQYRGLGGAIGSLGLSLNFFLAIKCFPVLIEAIGLNFTYCLYAGVMVVCLAVIYFLLPETKDRTLQDIENSFKGPNVAEKNIEKPSTVVAENSIHM